MDIDFDQLMDIYTQAYSFTDISIKWTLINLQLLQIGKLVSTSLTPTFNSDCSMPSTCYKYILIHWAFSQLTVTIDNIGRVQ